MICLVHQLLIRASTAKYLEIMLSVSLYYIRSEFHDTIEASPEDIEGNFCVQVASAEVLTKLCYLLLEIASDSGSGFSSFICDMLARSKIQRIALHCLLSTVYAVNADYRDSVSTGVYSMVGCANLSETQWYSLSQMNHLELQSSLLKLIKALIFLENVIGTENPANTPKPTDSKSKKKESAVVPSAVSIFTYVPYEPIVSQPMFISVVLSALKEHKWFHRHENWVRLVISCLPKFKQSLAKTVVPVVDQLCSNMHVITKMFSESYSTTSSQCSLQIPPDYMLILIQVMNSICHFCLINSSSVSSLVSATPRPDSSVSQKSEASGFSLFTNLANAFSSPLEPKKDTSEEGKMSKFVLKLIFI